MLAFAMSWLNGCATKIIDTSCHWTFTFELMEEDVGLVSDLLARQIVTHNVLREQICDGR